jgi:ABC-type oligopeptide transport system ATPase subunit
MKKQPLLQVKGLGKTFGSTGGFWRPGNAVPAVSDVSFSVEKGESFGLIGESGSGKTTVGRMLLRLIEPTVGTILYQGEDLTRLQERQMRPYRRKMQIVFQDSGSAFNPRQTVGEQVAYAATKFKLFEDPHELEIKVKEILEVVGLTRAMASRYPHELSGGQRQRVGIARSLILKPELLVLDEPVSALDVSVKAQIINLLVDLQKEFDLTYIFIAHNLDLVAYLCNKVAVMSKGRIVEMGDTLPLFRNPQQEVTKKLLGSILTVNGEFGKHL